MQDIFFMTLSGLTTFEAEERLRRYGLNEISETGAGFFRVFLFPLFSPISLMLLGAAVSFSAIIFCLGMGVFLDAG